MFDMTYYARAVGQFGDEWDQVILRVLRQLSGAVVDPGTEAFQLAYQTEGGMDFCLAKVRDCTALVFRRLPDGAVGAGVAKEALEAHVWGLSVWEIDVAPVGVRLRRSALLDGVLSVVETRERNEVMRAERGLPSKPLRPAPGGDRTR